MKFIVDTFPPSVFTVRNARRKKRARSLYLAEKAKRAQTRVAVSAAASAGLELLNPLPFVKTQMQSEDKLSRVVSVRVDEATHKAIAGLQLDHCMTEREACEVVRAALVVGLGVIVKPHPGYTLQLAAAVWQSRQCDLP